MKYEYHITVRVFEVLKKVNLNLTLHTLIISKKVAQIVLLHKTFFLQWIL